jgi:hypothetical protein
MEFFISVAVIALLIVAASFKQKRPRSAAQKTPPQASQKTTAPKQDLDWLHARWEDAEAARESGDFSYFKSWYFDPATDEQLGWLKTQGASLLGEPTYGQASDSIGLFDDADRADIEVLRFFRKTKQRASKTQAKELVRQLFSDPTNNALWESRPPEGIVKLFYSVYGIKLPKGMTHVLAKMKADDLTSENDQMGDVWCALDEVLDEMEDPQAREDYSIKKPSVAQLASAAKSLLQAGEEIDMSSIVDRLLELYPALER